MSFPSLKCRIDSLPPALSPSVPVDVLRLDLLHPVVSGNKWFKLKGYVAAAKREAKTTLLTFGGAYSNHIVATAAAAQMHGLKSVGIIRGEEPAVLSLTLLQAKRYGMRLRFVSRPGYSQKHIPSDVFESLREEDLFIIPEGGYGHLGMEGAKDILLQNETPSYTHILSAVGTGTTLAGLAAAASSNQKVIGIPVLKNPLSLQAEIKSLLVNETNKSFELEWDYHFGGYAKHNAELITFMNGFHKQTGIATDFVYTGKAFYAAFDLLKKNYFPTGSRLLLVHTGGLQGNASLKKGTLIWG